MIKPSQQRQLNPLIPHFHVPNSEFALCFVFLQYSAFRVPNSKMVREILHLDIRDFCIALERQRRPDLREWPVVVAPGQGRTVVQAVSAEAREEGIHPGMVVARARQYCRRLTVLPPDFSLYRQAQEKIVTALGRFSPLVEPASLGHFFVDATGTRRLWGGLLDRADLMRRLVDTEFQLDTAVGVASNKLVSRVASRVVKARELCDVFPGLEASFLAPLAVNVLPGVGEVTTARLLAELNLQTAGELAHVSPMLLSQIFGAVGQRLRSMALGEDPSPVLTPKAAPMLREEVQLPEDDNHRHRLLGYLYGLVEALGRRLRSQNRCPGELALTATYADGVQARARERLAVAGCEFHLDSFLYEAALRLFTQAVQRRIRLRRLSLNVAHLQTPFGQLALFPWDDPGRGKEVKLLRAIDQVRHRFGNEVLYYGRTEVRRQTTDDRGRRSEIRDQKETKYANQLC
jgi:DNA polymerase-4